MKTIFVVLAALLIASTVFAAPSLTIVRRLDKGVAMFAWQDENRDPMFSYWYLTCSDQRGTTLAVGIGPNADTWDLDTLIRNKGKYSCRIDAVSTLDQIITSSNTVILEIRGRWVYVLQE